MLLGAGDGTAAVVLVEHGVQKAKELQVIGQLSWLHMCALICVAKPVLVIYCCRYVLHRHDEAALLSLVWQGALFLLYSSSTDAIDSMRLHDSCSLASIDAARSWRGGGLLQPLRVSPCASEAMTAAQGNLN